MNLLVFLLVMLKSRSKLVALMNTHLHTSVFTALWTLSRIMQPFCCITELIDKISLARNITGLHTHTHTTHNHFTALLEYVRDHPGEQVPER